MSIPTIINVLCALVVAVLGVRESHAAKPGDKRGVLGMRLAGVAIVIASMVAAGASIFAGVEAERREHELFSRLDATREVEGELQVLLRRIAVAIDERDRAANEIATAPFRDAFFDFEAARARRDDADRRLREALAAAIELTKPGDGD